MCVKLCAINIHNECELLHNDGDIESSWTPIQYLMVKNRLWIRSVMTIWGCVILNEMKNLIVMVKGRFFGC
jgi:hypothetical protein